MTIDYLNLSEIYRPEKIGTLLVGEAPPPQGKTFFYLPRKLSNSRSIKKDCSLPTTIFYHYFGKRPESIKEYQEYLFCLKRRGIFLTDIYDSPIKVRGSSEGENIIIEAIPALKDKLRNRRINVSESRIIFLLARTSYQKHIRRQFPKSRLVPWIKFRMENIIEKK